MFEDTEESASVINIVCCGEDNEDRVGSKLRTSEVGRKANATIVHKNFNITQNISQQYAPVADKVSINRPKKAIFNEFNPDLISRKVQQSLSMNNDRVDSKPVRDTDGMEGKTKKHHVKVYQIGGL